MTHFAFVTPSSFEPREFLKSPALITSMDDARYFVSLILNKLARRDVDGQGLMRLHAKHLKNIMHQSDYAAVIEALLDGRAIERFPYSVGNRSFGFRLAARFVGDKHVRVPATDARLIRRLTAFHDQQEAERLARMLPVHHALARQQQRLRIRSDDARQTLDTLPTECNQFDTQGILIHDIERHAFHVNVGRYDRFTNNITSLKRELRDALHVGGEPLGSIDLSCAQPAFLGKLIAEAADRKNKTKAEGRPRGGREQSRGKFDSSFEPGGDLDLYVSLVQTGRFYDFMVKVLCDSGISRDEFKRRFLADVLAKKGRYPSVVEDTFRQIFPTAYQFIRETNRQGIEHANLIRCLQREESAFVIETVAADLVTRFPNMFCLTLRDAIYTTNEHLGKVEAAFLRAFDQSGFQMQFKLSS